MRDTLLLLLGPLTLAVCFVLALWQVEPFATFFYLFAWYSLIFTLDRLIRRREGHSLIRRCGRGFPLLLFWSAASWFFFELLNLRLENWYYVFVSDRDSLRLAGTFIAFATVFPGIFWIDHYLMLRGVGSHAGGRRLPLSPLQQRGLQLGGLLCFALPMLWPRYFFALVWGLALLLLAPANYRRGGDGLLRQLERGEYGPTLRLLLAGLIAGLCWEFFNFWARAKWMYTVPFFDEFKLFEMPLAGFVGFPPFAVECAAIYRFLVWHRLAPPCGVYAEQKSGDGRLAPRAVVFLLALLFCLGVYGEVERRTITSLSPRLEQVQALTPGVVEALKKRGIHYLTALEGWGSGAVWQDLQRELEPRDYAELQRLTRLYLHQGIGVEYGNLLWRAEIHSLEELGALSAAEVRRRLAGAAPHARLPSLAQIRLWIRRAPHRGGKAENP